MNTRGVGALIVWIAVLLIGALVILLFTLLAQGVAINQQDRIEQQSFETILSILNTQQTTPDITSDVPIPYSEIDITCTGLFTQEGTASSYALLNQLSVGGRSQNIRHRLMIGSDLETRMLQLFSRNLELPYDAGTILFISSPQETLSIDSDLNGGTGNAYSQRQQDELQEQIDRLMPENKDNPNLPGGGRTITLTISPDAPTPGFSPVNTDDSVKAWIQYDTLEDIMRSGNITMADGTGTPVKYAYIGEAMMWGYVWSGTQERINCYEDKLIQHINATLQIQEKRLDKILAEHDPASACHPRINAAKNQEDSIIVPSRQSTVNTNDELETKRLYDSTEVNNLMSELLELEETNQRLLRGELCATIY